MSLRLIIRLMPSDKTPFQLAAQRLLDQLDGPSHTLFSFVGKRLAAFTKMTSDAVLVQIREMDLPFSVGTFRPALIAVTTLMKAHLRLVEDPDQHPRITAAYDSTIDALRRLVEECLDRPANEDDVARFLLQTPTGDPPPPTGVPVSPTDPDMLASTADHPPLPTEPDSREVQTGPNALRGNLDQPAIPTARQRIS